MGDPTTSTSDIYLGAVYLALGAKLESVDDSDKKHMVFTFASDEVDFEDVRRKYINRELLVNAMAFKNAIQDMKGVLYMH